MSRFVRIIAVVAHVVLAGCGAPASTIPPSTPPSNAAAGLAAGACPVASDPDELGFMSGNRWTYASYRTWHVALGEHRDLVDVTVERVQTIGPYRVAWLAARYDGEYMPHAPTARVRDGKQTYLLLGDRPAPDVEAIREAIRFTAVQETGAGDPVSDCAGAFCGIARGSASLLDGVDGGWGGERSFASVPGLGMTWSTDGEYSPDTGDGGTWHVVLVGWKLTAAPSIATHAEPAAAKTVRLALRAAATAGDVPAVMQLARPDVRFTAISGADSAEDANAAWTADGGTAMRALAQATSGSCAAVGDATVVCPAELATVPCKRDHTAPRVVLQASNGAWKLAQLYAGGDDDVYAKLESESGPLRPLRLVVQDP